MLPASVGYADFAGLASLRAAALAHAPGALEGAAKQFEALFVHAMIKSMRESLGEDPLLGHGGRLFTQLFDQQLATEIAKSRSLGIAELLVRQLQGRWPSDALSAADADLAAYHPALEARRAPPRVRPASATPSASDPAPSSFETPAHFVAAMKHYALEAARRLKQDPRVLIAQAALETGWGRFMLRGPEGEESFNLFGIKADAGWTARKVVVPTLEYENGLLVRTRAAFRSYDSFEESFDDYVAFVREQPRYREALAARDPSAYIRALHRAGYATDPEYADKVIDLMARDDISSALGTQAGGEAFTHGE